MCNPNCLTTLNDDTQKEVASISIGDVIKTKNYNTLTDVEATVTGNTIKLDDQIIFYYTDDTLHQYGTTQEVYTDAGWKLTTDVVIGDTLNSGSKVVQSWEIEKNEIITDVISSENTFIANGFLVRCSV